MADRRPNLRLHASGLWTVRWAGRDYYFSRDEKASQRAFLDPKGQHPGALVHWLSWREHRSIARPITTPRRVAELVKEFLAAYFMDGRPETEKYYRHHLRRFTAVFGKFHVEQITPQAIDAFKRDLVTLHTLGPRTIRHDLNAIKTLWRWGYTAGMCQPLMLDTIKPPRVPRSHPEDLPHDQIKLMLANLPRAYRFLEPHLAINYLCLLRPSEVMRIALGQGRIADIPPQHGQPAIRRGLIILPEHKTAITTDADRLVLLSVEASKWLPHIKPFPVATRRKDPNSLTIREHQNRYAKLCRDAGVPGLPHKLRDSAASHLRALGEPAEAVDLLLGHEPTGVLRSYGRPALAILHRSASRLTLA